MPFLTNTFLVHMKESFFHTNLIAAEIITNYVVAKRNRIFYHLINCYCESKLSTCMNKFQIKPIRLKLHAQIKVCTLSASLLDINILIVLFQDYDQFDMANEVDELEKFLKLAPDDATVTSNAEIHLGNGEVAEQNSKPVEDAQNGDASEAVVGSTTNEDQQEQPVENGTHESNNVEVSEDGVDSSNAE